MRQKVRQTLLGALTSVALFCGAVGVGVLPAFEQETVVAETRSSATRMAITGTDYVYVDSVSVRSAETASFTSNNGYIANQGMELCPGLNNATATVLHCPDDAVGTYTLSFSGSHVYRKETGKTEKLNFRMVMNDEIVYPADGGWADCSNAGSDYDLKITMTLTMQAGDDLYFIVDTPDDVIWGAVVSVVAGMHISGGNMTTREWFDATCVNHINSANDEKTTDKYFGGTYTYEELFSYQSVEWYDYELTDIVDFSNYQKRKVADSATYSSSGLKQLWPGNDHTKYLVDMRGAEYYAFEIDNSNGTQALEFANELYERDGTSDGWGLFWSLAEYSEYFLINDKGIMSKYDTTAYGQYNAGKISVPAGFKGTVLLPLTSYEITSWQLPSVASHLSRFYKFGEPHTIFLRQIYRTDLTLITAPTEPVTVTNVAFWGADIVTESSLCPDTYQTAIQAIDNIGTVTAASANQILKAQRLYSKLSTEDQAKVHNYSVLTEAVETYAQLSDMSSYVGTYGKDFTGTDGVAFENVVEVSPSTVSAWIKVDKNVADDTHIGTIIGNSERHQSSQSMIDWYNTMSVEITTYGRPRFVWRKYINQKVNFVVNNVDVRTGDWLNLTFVRDTENSQIHCYINGEKVATKNVDSEDIAEITFIKPFVIGSDYTNEPNQAPGFTPDFNGSIANVRLYSGILTDDQVEENLSSIVSAGLLNDVVFRSGDDGDYYDSANVETLKDIYDWVENGDELLVKGDYSFAILGDTQMHLSVAKDGNGNSLYNVNYDETSNVFYKNIQWLIANKEDLNLQFVMHLGDLTDNGNYPNNKADDGTGNQVYKYDVEYTYGLKWLNMLTEANIPWSLARGNHEGGAERFNQYYTFNENGGRTTGYYEEGKMDNVYYSFDVGTQKYLVFALEYAPTTAVITWAKGVVEANPDRRVIITTHSYMGRTENLLAEQNADALWNDLASQYANVIMVVSGHATGTDIIRREDKGVNGNTVYQFMIDESNLNYSGAFQTGVFALLTFENNGNTIHFNYYSATHNSLFRTRNQFTIELDDNLFNDMDKSTTKYAKQEDLPLAVKPGFEAWPAFVGTETGGGYKTTSSDYAKATFARSGFTLQKSSLQAVNLHMSADGIFYFNTNSHFDGRNTSTLRLEVYLSNQDGTTRKVFPTRDGYYTIDKTTTWYLSQIGGVEVKNGDTLTLAYTTLDTAKYCYGRFDGYIATTTGETVNYILKAGYGSCSWADCQAMYDGTKTDYSVGYIFTQSSTYTKTLTVNDLDGNIVETIIAGRNGYYVLPNLTRAGHLLAGYIVDGELVPVGTKIQVTANKTITVAFVEMGMVNGASVRLDDPTGLRFSTQIKGSHLTALQNVNANLSFGTLIAMASDITTDGVVNYEALTRDCAVKKLDVLSTVNASVGNYTQFNGAVVGIKQGNLNKQFTGRGYMVVTYADGSTLTLYATVADNARSVVEVVNMALADVNSLATGLYQNAVSGGYSRYDADDISVLNGFIGA